MLNCKAVWAKTILTLGNTAAVLGKTVDTAIASLFVFLTHNMLMSTFTIVKRKT
jgi:hypothetical protein